MSNILEMLGLQSPGPVGDLGGAPDPLAGIPSYAAPAMPQDMSAPPQQPGMNVLQGMGAAPAAYEPPQQPMAPPPPQQPTRPARARSSILDAIGRVSDVLAQVGGATPLYQPTLDARQDRALTLGDHDRKVDTDKLALALSRQKFDSNGMDNATQSSKMIGQALRGLKAITTANPQADVSQIWPMLARQAGIPDDRAAVLGQAMASHPELIDGMIDAATDPKDDHTKFGFQPIYTKDAQGVLHVRQLSSDGTSQIPDGETPIDPFKAVDLGGSTALVGTRSGSTQRILPNSEKPGRAQDRASRERIAAGRNATTIQVAGMPARPKAGDGKGAGSMTGATMLLDNIENGFKELHGLNALPGDNGGAVGNVLSALGRTGIGQHIGEQAGSAAAQRRLLMEKDINSLQSEMVKSLPASATRTKFEQEIQRRRLPDAHRMDYATGMAAISDLRRSFAQAQRDAAAETAGKPGGRPILRAPARTPVRPNSGSKPTVSNW